MRYVSNRARAEQEIGADIRRALEDIAFEYERILDGMFTLAKTGRLYGNRTALKRFAKSVARGRQPSKTTMQGVHTASAPGEAPAVWHSHLRTGVKHAISRVDAMTFSVQIGVSVQSGRSEIAQMLEFGTSRMAPRPAWRPALAILQQRLSARAGR